MPTPAPSSSHRSLACEIVLTQARSAAYIGCSGSIASGMPAGRAYSSSSPIPSRTISRALARSFDAGRPALSFGRPPTTRTRHGAPSVERLVDRALVVIERRAPAAAIQRRKHSAPAIAGQRKAGIAYALGRFLESGRGDLVAPGRDAADAAPRATGDDLGQAPLRAHRRGVDRKQVRIGRAHRPMRPIPRSSAGAGQPS